jgi:glutaredoxin
VFPGCPYCKLAAELLTEKYGITITFVDIENPEKR